MRCVNCGYEIAEGQKECPACGYRVVKVMQSMLEEPPADVSNISKYMAFMSNDGLYKAGTMLMEGIGMAKNYPEALKVLRTLAGRGHQDGMYKLAELYLKITPPDRASALFWLKTAAAKGHLASQIRLSEMNVPYQSAAPQSGESVTAPAAGSAPLNDSFVNKVKYTMPHVLTIQASRYEGNVLSCSRGAGFILDGGYVITNAHVIDTDSQLVTASFESGIDPKSYELQKLALEPDYDVAVLRFKGAAGEKISSQKHLDLRLGPVVHGEEVYTIGNPLGMGLSVSRGIISHPNRECGYPKLVPTAIQTDMTINHGNSGGALFSSDNRVVGLITFYPDKSNGGISMAVPSEYIVKVLNKL